MFSIPKGSIFYTGSVGVPIWLAEDIVSSKYDPYEATSYDKICENLKVIQRRYTCLLDEFYKGAVFGKKGSEEKRFLEPYVSGVSLGKLEKVLNQV